MKNTLFATPVLVMLLISACVTVNIYFPAAAAEKVADEIIDGIQKGRENNQSNEPEASLNLPALSYIVNAVLSFGISEAHAADANLSIDSAEIRAVRARMTSRFGQLNPAYAQGQIGILSSGLITVRDPNAVPLRDRNQLNQLVAAENKDRAALYQAIAVANGHPEWATSIKATFARRWIGNAGSGWWYQANGAWRQK